jgi:hypothetical protein
MGAPDVYSASDYAGLATENASFYYGYEVTDEDYNWCFTAKIGDEEIKIPFPKLGAKDQWNCVECLMTGIGWVLTKYKIDNS